MRCLAGLCEEEEEEEERVTGKEHPSCKGTAAPQHRQGPWAPMSQSAELGFTQPFHVCLQIITVLEF